MKKIFVLLFISVSILGFSPIELSKRPNIENTIKNVIIYQNGKLIENKRGIYYLKREEFDLVFRLTTIENNYLVNFSTKDTSYNQALGGNKSENILAYYYTGMAEGLFNEDYSVILRDNASHAFYYKNEENHRFNKVEIKNNFYILTRTIKKLYDFEGKTEKSIVDTDLDYLYIVALEYKYDKDSYKRIDKSIEAIKIKFID